LLSPVPEGDELEADESDVRDDEGLSDEADEVESLFSSLSVVKLYAGVRM
jgi:hypothetical protein